MTTKTIIEAANINSHCPNCHVNDRATTFFSSFAAYRLGIEDGLVNPEMPAHELEVEVGSYEWALAESNGYGARGFKPPYSIQRVVAANEKA